jgi:hypothetical protein
VSSSGSLQKTGSVVFLIYEDTASKPSQSPSASTSGTTAKGARFRFDTEGLRGVAILLVLLFRAQIPGFTGGFFGVDIFLCYLRIPDHRSAHTRT